MLFDRYKEEELVWLNTMAGETSQGNFAFRGDLIVTPGALNEAAKKRNPPEAIIKEAVMLFKDDKIAMVVGNFADVFELPQFAEKFGADLADDCKPVFFVDNLKDSALLEIGGRQYTLITFRSGVIWNELLDLVYLEKSDLKSQKSEDKIETVYEAFQSYKPKYATSTLDDVLANRTDAKREAWGAI